MKGIHVLQRSLQKGIDKMLYVADGDALVEDDFNFDYEVPKKIWMSRLEVKIVNELAYGYELNYCPNLH